MGRWTWVRVLRTLASVPQEQGIEGLMRNLREGITPGFSLKDIWRVSVGT
jgi:hypothetical protein